MNIKFTQRNLLFSQYQFDLLLSVK